MELNGRFFRCLRSVPAIRISLSILLPSCTVLIFKQRRPAQSLTSWFWGLATSGHWIITIRSCSSGFYTSQSKRRQPVYQQSLFIPYSRLNLIAAVDGLTGPPVTINSIFPETEIQLCASFIKSEIRWNVWFGRFETSIQNTPPFDAAEDYAWCIGSQTGKVLYHPVAGAVVKCFVC